MREGDEHLRKTVAELEASRQDLQEKITELERFHDVTVGCEMEKEIVHLREEDAVLKLKAQTQSSQDCCSLWPEAHQSNRQSFCKAAPCETTKTVVGCRRRARTG